MPKLKMAALVAGMFVALLGTAAVASGQALPRPDTWVDGELFAGVVTPATFSPSSGNFDELYMCPGGFKDGVSLISESKPGDQDYNGGRWHLNVGTNCGAYGVNGHRKVRQFRAPKSAPLLLLVHKSGSAGGTQ